MDEANFLEEIRTWEHPPWYGTTQFEEKVKEIFLENQKGLHLHHLKTHFRMPVKHEMIFAPLQDTSYTAITLNPESNFVRREKNHSLSHLNTLPSPEFKNEFGCYARAPHRWLLEYRWIKRFVWFLDRFALLSEKPPEGYIWSGRRLTKR